MSDFYTEMMSRNWAFIPSDAQNMIRSTRLLIAGCGLGSVVSTLAVQTGFTKLTLIDHDDVEVSNLNRQAFSRADVGVNKARALSRRLLGINDSLDLDVREEAVTLDNVESLVSSADIILNTVDFDDVDYALNAAARDQGKPVLFPMNIAWGGFCLVFLPDSVGLEQLVGETPPASDSEFIMRLMSSLEDFVMPDYLAARFSELPQIVGAEDMPAPQLGIAATLSASLTVESMVRLAWGLPVKTAPRPIYVDPWEA